MEAIRGKRSFDLDGFDLQQRVGGFADVWLDLGTGDGRFVQWMARQNPARFFIGIDACRENLRASSLKARPNVLYLIAAAELLPAELMGVARRITINFPWGSLLDGLLAGTSLV